MDARLVAGACAIALAGLSGARHGAAPDRAEAAAHPVVVRVTAPLPDGVARGHVSFVSTFAGKRWSFAAASAGDADRAHLSLVLVSEPAEDD